MLWPVRHNCRYVRTYWSTVGGVVGRVVATALALVCTPLIRGEVTAILVVVVVVVVVLLLLLLVVNVVGTSQVATPV